MILSRHLLRWQTAISNRVLARSLRLEATPILQKYRPWMGRGEIETTPTGTNHREAAVETAEGMVGEVGEGEVIEEGDAAMTRRGRVIEAVLNGGQSCLNHLYQAQLTKQVATKQTKGSAMMKNKSQRGVSSQMVVRKVSLVSNIQPRKSLQRVVNQNEKWQSS